MGVITQETINADRIKINYVSSDKDDGLLQSTKTEDGKYSKTKIMGVEGYLLGIGKSSYNFKDKEQEKINVFIKDNKNANEVYQMQFGIYTWATWIILNKLLSARETIQQGDKFSIMCQPNKDNAFFNWFVSVNGNNLKQRFKRSDENDAKSLKFKPTGDPDNDKIKNKHIDAWFEKLYEVIGFEESNIRQIPKDNENEVENLSEEYADVPF